MSFGLNRDRPGPERRGPAATDFSTGGLSATSLRWPAALAGTGAVPLAWWGTRLVLRHCGVARALRAWPALLAAYLVGFSAWSVFLSRWGRFYSLGQLLFLAGVLLAIAAFTAEGRSAPRLTATGRSASGSRTWTPPETAT